MPRVETMGVLGGRVRCETVLVVEDDDDIRATLEDVLAGDGYAVSGAANGREALALLETLARPCLILLDLMMPVMNGREFLAALRADDALAPIPVVIVSAWPDEARATKGAQGFVKKPVELDVLRRVVHAYC
jgi:CheY-like chemotaxis protein